jgi:hypothetical protein
LEGCGLGCKCGGGGEEGCDEEVAEGRHDEDDTTTERNATMQNYELARLRLRCGRCGGGRWRWPVAKLLPRKSNHWLSNRLTTLTSTCPVNYLSN